MVEYLTGIIIVLRSAKNVELDITHAKKNLGPEAEFTFLDDELFTYSIDHVEDIAPFLLKIILILWEY